MSKRRVGGGQVLRLKLKTRALWNGFADIKKTMSAPATPRWPEMNNDAGEDVRIGVKATTFKTMSSSPKVARDTDRDWSRPQGQS